MPSRSAPTPWAVLAILALGIIQILTDVLYSVRASDWKKFRREMAARRLDSRLEVAEAEQLTADHAGHDASVIASLEQNDTMEAEMSTYEIQARSDTDQGFTMVSLSGAAEADTILRLLAELERRSRKETRRCA